MLPGPDSEPEDLDQALSSVARAIADSLELKEVWGRVADACRAVVPFDESHVETTVRRVAAERGIKAGPLIHAIRVAVTGRTASPGLFEVLVLLGQARTIARLERLVSFLATRA